MLKIPDAFIQQMIRWAEEKYPEEACGLVLGKVGSPENWTRFVPIKNVQGEYHQKDPQTFPGTVREAYFMDPYELLRVQKEARVQGEEIRVIYHSHPDAAAYFSEEDQLMAAPSGEPVYPGVDYWVISVLDGKSVAAVLFRWNPEEHQFVAAQSQACF